jgi:GTP cyclohydrolase IA
MNDMDALNVKTSFEGPIAPMVRTRAVGRDGSRNGATRRSPANQLERSSRLGVASQRTVDLARIERAVREILCAIGENPDRDGLRETPGRVARAYRDIFSGLAEDAGRHLEIQFEHESDQLVVVSGIDFSSTCEHHLLPFFGKAHVAYLPANGHVVGLSKLARTVDVFARRPQLQERLTEQVAEALHEYLSPRGLCVVLEAEHFCMRIRGACKPNTLTTTLAVRGLYREDATARAEALSLMKRVSKNP